MDNLQESTYTYAGAPIYKEGVTPTFSNTYSILQKKSVDMRIRPSMHLNTYLTLLILMLTCITARSQSESTRVEVTSLEELINLAKERNPDLKSYILNVEKSSYDFKISKATLLPSISGSFSGQKNIDLATTPVPGEFFGQPGTTVNAQFGQQYAYNAGISVNKVLLDWQSNLKVKMAKLTLKTSESQRDAYLIVLHQLIATNYYSILIAKRAIVLAEKDLEIADSVLVISEQKFEEGLIDASTINLAKINSNLAKQNLHSSKQLYSNTCNDIKVLLGLNEKDTLQIVANSSLSLPPMYSVSELAPEERIKLASLSEQQAQYQVAIQKSMYLPKLSLNGYYGKQQFREDFGLDLGNNTWSNYSFVGFNLSVPIFNGFAYRNKLKISKIDLNLSEIELNKANLESHSQDIKLVEEYRTSISNTKLALEAFQLYEENERLALQKYSEGVISLDRYFNAFEDYLKSENAYLNGLLTTYSLYSQIIPRVQ